MNSVFLIGRIVNDLELKQTPSGKSVLNFSIAVNMDKETVYFFDLVAWNVTAQNIARYFKKGSQIGVSGMLTTRTSEYNGQKRKYTEVKVNSFDFIGAKSDNASANDFSTVSSPIPNFEELDPSDDLPF